METDMKRDFYWSPFKWMAFNGRITKVEKVDGKLLVETNSAVYRICFRKGRCARRRLIRVKQ